MQLYIVFHQKFTGNQWSDFSVVIRDTGIYLLILHNTLATVFKTICNFSIVYIKSLAKHQGSGVFQKYSGKTLIHPCSHKKHIEAVQTNSTNTGTKHMTPLWRFQCIYVCVLYYNVHDNVYKDLVHDLSHYLHLCTCTLNA